MKRVTERLADLVVRTENAVLDRMIIWSLKKQNEHPQEAQKVVERMLNATTNMSGEVEIRYTLLHIITVGKYLLSNSATGHIRYLSKKTHAEEIADVKSKLEQYEKYQQAGIPCPFTPPVVVFVTMTKAVFLGIYKNMVDAETAWYHGEIITEGGHWLFHSIVLLSTFDIFRKTLGFADESDVEVDINDDIPAVT